MNKKHLAGYAIVATAFGVLGAIAGVKQDAKGPVTTTVAPTDGRAHTGATNLYAQSLNDLPASRSRWPSGRASRCW
jgi:hypothetical protein